MESLKKLKDVAEECLKDLKSIDSKISVSEGNLAFLESKKVALGTEILQLEKKKIVILEIVGGIEKDARDTIDTRMREIKAKEEQLVADRADLKTKLLQAGSANDEAEAAKVKYAALYAEYLTKSQELEDKKQAILAAAK